MIPPEHRALLTRDELAICILRDTTGWGYRPIARYLCMSETTVRDHLARAVQKIADHLDQETA